MEISFFKEIKEITTDLVSIESIVKKGSETKMAEFVYDYYSNLDYFKKNPENLILQQTVNDDIKRHNTICLLKGNSKSNKTVVLLGHIDTVGVDDFKYLKDYAFDSEKLVEQLSKEDLSEEIRKDLQSQEYMFGRGALDMKSGVANHMAIIKYFSENLDKLNGNIVAVAECDEEDSSMGIISALDVLKDLKDKEDLDYQVTVNSDFTTPLYKGDNSRYIYLGTVGKLLPSFYIGGVETHVGQGFFGVDPTLVGSEIDREFNLNMEYSDYSKGEATIPPVCLQFRDLKEKYDVQTSSSSNLYYNYATHSQSPKDVIEIAKTIAKKSLEKALKYKDQQYKLWCEKGNYEYKKVDYNLMVYTWEEYDNHLKEIYKEKYTEFLEDLKNSIDKDFPELSHTEFNLKLIDSVYKKFHRGNDPTVIVYYGSTFYQNVEINGKDKREQNLIESLERTISKTKDFIKEEVKLKYFYPYISDSSFMYLPEDKSGILAYKNNFPSWGVKYKHPIEKIEKISMPVINLGVYGQDGHKLTERVHMKYSFQSLPNLIKTFIEEVLG